MRLALVRAISGVCAVSTCLLGGCCWEELHLVVPGWRFPAGIEPGTELPSNFELRIGNTSGEPESFEPLDGWAPEDAVLGGLAPFGATRDDLGGWVFSSAVPVTEEDRWLWFNETLQFSAEPDVDPPRIPAPTPVAASSYSYVVCHPDRQRFYMLDMDLPTLPPDEAWVVRTADADGSPGAFLWGGNAVRLTREPAEDFSIRLQVIDTAGNVSEIGPSIPAVLD